MAATIVLNCNACGGRHMFFLPTADLFDVNAQYEYTCPKTITTARMTTGGAWNNAGVLLRPRDSVVVRQVGN